MKTKLKTVITGLAIATNVAALELPDIFKDDMVLQQQSKAKIWGWAAPGNTISLTTSWDGAAYVAKTDDEGRWTTEVQTPKASYQEYAIHFEEKNSNDSSLVDQTTSQGVLVGEVWFCSGQSNMEMPLVGFWNCPVEGAQDEIVYSGRYRKSIRVATVPKLSAETPQQKVPSPWKRCEPKNVAQFTACGYFFAQTLVDMLDVPVGIINCSYGGSCVEGWMPKEALLKYPDGLTPIDETKHHSKMAMYNAMLSPLAGYKVKGFLWNQGESNVGREKEYADKFCMMVRVWRHLFGDKNLPIYAVELPPFGYGDVDATNAADFRVVQHSIAKSLPNYGCVCTSDLVYDYEKEQAHGSQKKKIGQRLAYMALSRDYGFEGIPYEYPTFEYMEEVEANEQEQTVIAGTKVTHKSAPNGKVLHLYFTHSKDGFDRLSDIEGFEAQSEDDTWHKAKVWAASTWNSSLNREGCYLVLSCPETGTIKNIRYCYHNFTVGKLHNVYGMPVVPFTTEKQLEKTDEVVIRKHKKGHHRRKTAK